MENENKYKKAALQQAAFGVLKKHLEPQKELYLLPQAIWEDIQKIPVMKMFVPEKPAMLKPQR